LPRNFVSQKPYRGINVFLLLAMCYESPFWLTFRQALQLGGSVRKGEKSCPVIFWKQTTFDDKESGEPQKIPLLRFYHVFNVAQCDGLKISSEPVETHINGIIKPDEIVAHMPQRPEIKHGMARAFYSPGEDCVGLPVRERFERAEGYYATLFHELVHATGHESRLNRSSLTEKSGFGSNPYCKEELIAEMGAAFLCGQAEIASRDLPPWSHSSTAERLKFSSYRLCLRGVRFSVFMVSCPLAHTITRHLSTKSRQGHFTMLGYKDYLRNKR
jgi:antirestriction protein ArdC